MPHTNITGNGWNVVDGVVIVYFGRVHLLSKADCDELAQALRRHYGRWLVWRRVPLIVMMADRSALATVHEESTAPYIVARLNIRNAGFRVSFIATQHQLYHS